MPGQAPHGKFVTIYANQPALATLTSDSTAMPEGAVFAKSNFNSIGELENVTVMYRKLSGWVWLVYEPDGAVKRAGRLDDCLACHAGAEKDGVFSWGRR
jgi:acyl-CoA synthetase (AMP-forming)/AMP-acid ligase II